MYNQYKSKRYHLSQYFPDILVKEIQKYLLPNKIINHETLFQDILLFYNFKRYIMKKGYFIKYYIKNFNKRLQVNSCANYNFDKKYCLRHNKQDIICLPSCYKFIYMMGINHNFLRLCSGLSGLSYSC